MPLVTISGFPSSGKTTRAQELKKAFAAKEGSAIADIHIINDESLGIPKGNYRDREPEKAARGEQMAAVKRLLSKNSLVILDNLSYIKGFRYQLFCEAKALSTNSCVVHVGTPVETCQDWNKARGEDGWPQDLFDALVFRYEEPNGMSRWDSPLFIVTPEEALPTDEIWDALINKVPVKPNHATTVKAALPASYLSTLNETTNSIVKQVMELHQDAAGSRVVIASKPVTLPLRLSLPQLNRIRRNFVQLNKAANIALDSIGPFFVEFLEKNWELE